MWAFQILTKANAKTNILTNDNESLIHYSVNGIGNSLQFLRTLKELGNDLNLKNKFNETALELAHKRNLDRIAKLLVELGAVETKPSVQPKPEAPKKEIVKKVEFDNFVEKD